MNYLLNELLDVPTVQALLDSLDEINKLPSAILDRDGNILTATSWQDVCTKFHRVNRDSASRCHESDTRIKVNLGESVAPVIYNCPMGLVDAASPIIVEGQHLGNVFIGQLFMEQHDEAYFVEQSKQFGFDEAEYLEAVRRVPLCSEKHLLVNLNFISSFVTVLAEKGLQSKRQLESERELQKSEEKLKVIFDTSEAGIIVVSPHGVITFANKRMASMFGLPLDELIGSKYIDYVHETDKHAGIKCMKQIAQGEKTSIELVRHYVRKDGSDFWGHLTGTRFENIDGSMRDQIIVISDVTELRRAEEEKRLLEQQLQQAQKMESLGVLAGGIAHDFNNILAIINGNCYLAKNEPSESEKYLSFIENAVERAAGLCRQMMAYAGKAPFDISTINLALLIDEMVRMLKSTIPQNVIINFKYPDQVAYIAGDTNQLSQIIMNLIINASEAIGEKQGEVNIFLSKSTVDPEKPETDYTGQIIPSGNYLCLVVTDNGTGMDDETKKRIFEPFYTTKFLGRGLGMSAVIGIIKAHNGSLQIQSSVGLGSTFKIFLPIKPTHPDMSVTVKQVEAPESEVKECTVLLVEDEDQVRMIAKSMLKRIGFTVIEAANGLEAFEQYKLNFRRIKLVVTDIGMPVMDGYELIQKLKNLNPILPIVISSGFSDLVVTSRIPREEIAGFVGKPYHFEQMREILVGLLKNG